MLFSSRTAKRLAAKARKQMNRQTIKEQHEVIKYAYKDIKEAAQQGEHTAIIYAPDDKYVVALKTLISKGFTILPYEHNGMVFVEVKW